MLTAFRGYLLALAPVVGIAGLSIGASPAPTSPPAQPLPNTAVVRTALGEKLDAHMSRLEAYGS